MYEQLCAHAREAALLDTIQSILGWDERCRMPEAGGDYRAEQMKLLAGLHHERLTDPRMGDWLGELSASPLAAEPFSDTGATIRQLKRDYEKRIKLPRSMVEELTRLSVLGQQAWQQARRDSDFAQLQPWLEKIVAIKQQQADALGYAEVRYDALLDEFEPEALTSQVRGVLEALRDELVPLVRAIAESGRQADISILERTYPAAVQAEFSHAAATAIGFNFEHGRLDTTAHPFCTSLGPNDCRIATRYDEHHFNGGFFGVLHEAGHGIYDQGLRADQYGLPLGSAVSLGIHESQSRMWENHVGRHRAFWDRFYPLAQQAFPSALGDVPADAFYFAINDVRPSLIRVEADEATYNLHILIRFELEQALIEGDLPVADLPAAWNERYRQYLGIVPPNDRQGVLQDIHWSGCALGYFPTYSLGNLYAAQFFAFADRRIGPLADQFRQGQFHPLKQWLNSQIHEHGQRWPSAELLRQVTGEQLSHRALMEYLRGKLSPLYGL